MQRYSHERILAINKSSGNIVCAPRNAHIVVAEGLETAPAPLSNPMVTCLGDY